MQIKPRRAYKTREGRVVLLVNNKDATPDSIYPFKNVKTNETYMFDGRFIAHDSNFTHPHSIVSEVKVENYSEITIDGIRYIAVDIDGNGPEFMEITTYGR